ncbi:hypothetical protein OZY43_05645 [Lactobacillus sp. ESL0785]|uniref:hypothetical protein n=1 Tax=Lactobacillus sp. ESL0785 TaxID=2983232 RepID=UPI0023F71715|nr:hypothetical protein [Lactobacillus sp. ESL0785]WEV70438.1 hypothetical protein OZY43_05645 [Lactobacillus sp. ESL0785]
MKHFSLGLMTGAALGIVLSMFKTKSGDRIGKPIKREFNGAKEDANSLLNAANDFKQAKQELTQALPQAQKTIGALQDEIKYYQKKMPSLIENLKDAEKAINHDLKN